MKKCRGQGKNSKGVQSKVNSQYDKLLRFVGVRSPNPLGEATSPLRESQSAENALFVGVRSPNPHYSKAQREVIFQRIAPVYRPLRKWKNAVETKHGPDRNAPNYSKELREPVQTTGAIAYLCQSDIHTVEH